MRMLEDKTGGKEHSRDFVRVARGAAAALSGAGVGTVAGAITVVLLTRTLGVRGYGQLALALAVVTLVQTLTLVGLPQGLSRMLSFARSSGDEDQVERIFKASILVALSTGFAGFVGLLALAHFRVIDKPGVPTMLAITAPLLFATALRTCMHGALRSLQDVRGLLVSSMVTPLLDVLAIGVLVVAGIRDAAWYGIALVGAASGEAVLLTFLVRRRAKIGWLFRTSRADAKRLLSFSLPFVLVQFLFLAMQHADVVILGLFHPTSSVGLYTPVMRLGHIVEKVMQAFPLLFVPIATGYVAQNRMDDLRQLYVTVTKWAYAVAFVVIIAVVVTPAFVLPFLFGAPYGGMVTESRVVGLGYWATLLTGLNGVTLGVLGLQRRAAKASVLAVILNVGIGLLLIPPFGPLGAAWSNTLAYVFVNALFTAILFKHSHISPFRRDMMSLFAYSVLVVVSGYAASELLPLHSYLHGFFLLAAVAALWLGGTLLIKTFQMEWGQMKEVFLLRRRGRKHDGEARGVTVEVARNGGRERSGEGTHVARPLDRPVFPLFVGRGRSGTTLTRAIFDSHPMLAVPPESPFLVGTARKRRFYQRDGGFDCDRFLADVLPHPRFHLWALDEIVVRRHMTQVRPTSYPDAIRALYRLYAQRNGKPLHGDKSPRTTGALPLLAELFPEMRFVHIIRDGRDVALSHMQVDFGPDNLVQAAIEWRREVGKCRREGLELGPERYRELRYEDLVADPQRGVGEVCEFIGLEFDDRMLRYFERASEVIRSTPAPGAHDRLFMPPTKGLRDWRREMSVEDTAVFEVIAGDLLEELGYERSTEKAVLRARMEARWGQLAHEVPRRARRYRNHMRPKRVLQHFGRGV